MKNIEFLYKENKGNHKLNPFKDFNINYISNIEIFNFAELKKVINFISTIENKYGNTKFLKINLIYNNQLSFTDKLTIILLECFLYNQIIEKKRQIYLIIKKLKSTIYTEGVLNSCIGYTKDNERFIKLFKKDISNNHFRIIVNYDEWKNKPSILSFVTGNLRYFLVNCNIEYERAKQVANIIIELADNALEHSSSDCLIDLDVTTRPYEKNKDNKDYYAINIAVVDFSEKLLGKDIKNIIESGIYKNEAYNKLRRIKEIHSLYFNSEYDETQFYLMSAFQNKISGRKNSNLTGGRGLTTLIEGLQQDVDSDVCYVVSGNKCLFFYKEHIKQDIEKWVGFNNENNIEFPPDKAAFKYSPLHILGTAYNLTFIFKKGDLI